MTSAKNRKRSQTLPVALTEADIPRLPGIILTKRILLGLVNSQYDPMGLICPILIILKINLRDLFGPGVTLGWDDALPSELHEKWISVLSMFIRMGEIVVDRAVRPEGVEDVPELIGFADGSLMAYACAIYVRWKKVKKSQTDPDRYFVRLVCGKARVTSAKGTTTPRSEISGYLILVRLLKVVLNAMDEKPSRITTAVGSQCTISALEKAGGLLAPYFASRVSEALGILSELGEHAILDPVQHVPGILNPADIPTRDNTLPDEVRDDSTWQRGPAYLSLPREQWPFSRDFIDIVPESELRSPKAAFNAAVVEPWKNPLESRLSAVVLTVMSRSNCLAKTTHVTARLLKCYFGHSQDKISEPLTVDDIKVARLVQFIASMEPTVHALQKGELDPLTLLDPGFC